MARGKLYVVGIGPGYEEHMTFRAKQCIEESDVIVGYETYIALIERLMPGVSALNACAALIGSPLMTDFAVVSMSDLLMPWDVIVQRVDAAAKGDFVIVIYNPQSKKRVHQLQDTREILLKYREPSTPVAIVKAAYRDVQKIVMTDLEHILEHTDSLGMLSTIIVGNSSTFMYDGLMINPRGYKSKYSLVKEAQEAEARA